MPIGDFRASNEGFGREPVRHGGMARSHRHSTAREVLLQAIHGGQNRAPGVKLDAGLGDIQLVARAANMHPMRNATRGSG